MAVKRLLRQTLSHDDEMIEVHSLAELILSEGVRLGAGSSIKTDGEESDPWALVGVVDIAKHRVRLAPSVRVSRTEQPVSSKSAAHGTRRTQLLPLFSNT
jgi:protein BCP1